MRKLIATIRDVAVKVTHPVVTASVQLSPKGRLSYNLPTFDMDAASQAILRDVGLLQEHLPEHPLDRARFWEEGRWFGHEWAVRDQTIDEFTPQSTPLPTSATFSVIKKLEALLGAPVIYNSRCNDIGITMPGYLDATTMDEALNIVRTGLPHSVVGFDASRRVIVVSSALA
jgi:hypothetical protein